MFFVHKKTLKQPGKLSYTLIYTWYGSL